MKRYHYPALSNRDLGFVRIGGAGLANCMFVAARAYIAAQKNGEAFVAPTWRKFSIGPILRHERDKRLYNRLFNDIGAKELKKILLLIKLKWFKSKNIIEYSGLGNYFADLNQDYPIVKQYFDTITRHETVKLINREELTAAVGVHIRLGDYLPQLRVSLDWYVGVIKSIRQISATTKIFVFSDGSDEELRPILSLPGVERRFFGNAFADMTALSLCKVVVASDSTFSAWGAFLGQVPLIFNRCHFGNVYGGRVPEAILGDSTELPPEFKQIFSK
jgi:hypothetical protein